MPVHLHRRDFGWHLIYRVPVATPPVSRPLFALVRLAFGPGIFRSRLSCRRFPWTMLHQTASWKHRSSQCQTRESADLRLERRNGRRGKTVVWPSELAQRRTERHRRHSRSLDSGTRCDSRLTLFAARNALLDLKNLSHLQYGRCVLRDGDGQDD